MGLVLERTGARSPRVEDGSCCPFWVVVNREEDFKRRGRSESVRLG